MTRSSFELWNRQLERFPTNGKRATYLAITVAATVVLYYQLYVQGAVVTKVLADLDMSLSYFILGQVVGGLVGVLGSLAAGLADRWGRANLVVYGLVVVSLLVGVGAPNVGSPLAYMVVFGLIAGVEGVVLVATPALIRDFSPQLSRASAMGFWTLGPVLGSLLVTAISSNTLDNHHDWQFQFRVAGVIGAVISLVAFIGLRELAPPLRDQRMVSLRDRALLEARARDISGDQPTRGHWQQMMTSRILIPAGAISCYLLFYYVAVGFLVLFLVTTFGYSDARANSLATWYWIVNALSLMVFGVLSDVVGVRKPFMIVGGLISAFGVGWFAVATGDSGTSYYLFATIIVVIALGTGMTFATWMAAFTETVEASNPAATVTGLAVWGACVRVVVALSFTALVFAIPAAGVLAEFGPHVTHTSAAVKAGAAVPAADLHYLAQHGEDVRRAARNAPRQWQQLWWVCLAAQLMFLPSVWLLAGRWRPASARADALRHRAQVEEETFRLAVRK
ncbi:MFS transporter [Nocardia sp. NPDC058705]|uniref:MFS transporter n=1 Tax=Nocardia sp. NPDC058705 TaxID=3346609 RepID=UPI0036AD73B7